MNTALPDYRVSFFGTLGVFSYSVLRNLLLRNVKVANVVIPGAEPAQSPNKLIYAPTLKTPKHATIEHLAIENNIPIQYVLGRQLSELLTDMSQPPPDFILTACFPYKLPQAITQLAEVAALNLHPSLLPAYRGPYPIFWQLRNNEPRMGITLHILSDELDAGDVILQAEVKLRPGMRGRAIDNYLGLYGAAIFTQAMRQYATQKVNTRAQDSNFVTRQGTPNESDFNIATDWSARHAFSFIRGTSEWGHSYNVAVDGKHITIKAAAAYSPSGQIECKFRLEDNYITLQCNPGLINAYISNIT